MDLAKLRAEFPREAIHWRAQSVTKDGKKAMALAYLDARDVMDRLDEAVGPANWQDSYHETAKGRLICTLRIRIGDEWVAKSDGAGETDVEGEKGAISAALKRAAVKWGVGRYLYDMPAPWVPCEVGPNGKWRKWAADPWQFVRNLPKVPDYREELANEPEPKLPDHDPEANYQMALDTAQSKAALDAVAGQIKGDKALDDAAKKRLRIVYTTNLHRVEQMAKDFAA